MRVNACPSFILCLHESAKTSGTFIGTNLPSMTLPPLAYAVIYVSPVRTILSRDTFCSSQVPPCLDNRSELTLHPPGRVRRAIHHQPRTRMPNLLTIPTEIRLKILDYAISDLSATGCFIDSVDAKVGDWRFDRRISDYRQWTFFKNPNVNIALICNQIRNECNSSHVRKPTLEAPSGYGNDSHCFWHILQCWEWEDLHVHKMMSQISSLKMCDEMPEGWYRSMLFENLDSFNPKGAMETVENRLTERFRRDLGHVCFGGSYEVEIELSKRAADEYFAYEFVTTVSSC